ncbi:hypothetical protein KAT55_04675 [Candidatus Bathyarchaeota archaeon]|nr:hypothetical protein [Candidatus Bathyarchaeota archaeon]
MAHALQPSPTSVRSTDPSSHTITRPTCLNRRTSTEALLVVSRHKGTASQGKLIKPHGS